MRIWFIGCLLALSAITFGYQGGSGETASIEGQVVSLATGAPLKSAIVRLRQVPQSTARRVVREIVRQTNEEGRFLFANVPSGDWELSADKRGFVPGIYGARKYDPQGRRISVTGKAQIDDLVLRLASQAVIAGRVLDNEDQPVEGARVALLKVSYTNGNPRWTEVASTATLDNGEYRIPRVAAGRYLVRCGITKVELAPSISGNQTTYAAAYHPNVAEPSIATAIDVRDDGAEISGIDIRVAPVRLFHVRGKFHAPSDRQAQVFLVEKSDPSKVFAESVAGPPEYHFDFPGIPPGSYIAGGWSMEGFEFSASQLVDVKSEDVDNVILSAADRAIQGSVKLKPGGRKVDLNTLAVEIRPNWLEKARNEVVLSPVKFADELKFRFAKTYGFFASFAVRISNFPEGCYLASVRYGDRDVPDSGIEYSSGAMLEISIGSDGARVDGQTVDKDGNTLGGAVVALSPAAGRSAVRSVKSGSQGAFHITGVPPGEYKLLAWDDVGPDDLSSPDFVARFEGQTTSVKLEANGAVSASIRVIVQEAVR